MRIGEGRPTAEIARESGQGVRVWQVDLRQPAGWVQEAAAALLEPGERHRHGRETREVARRRQVARAALRIALSRWLGCSPRALRFVRDSHGKPGVAGAGALHFNLARSGDCCLIAITTIGPIGVDVERAVAVPELQAIASTRFAPTEAAAILRLTGERRVRAFYNCWTRKEAYLKARGVGLGAPLDGVTVTVDDGQPSIVALEHDDPDAWSLVTVRPGRGLIGAVAVRGAPYLRGQVITPGTLPLGLRLDVPA